MLRELAVVLYYSWFNRYSVNAITAALDLKAVADVFLVESSEGVIKTASLLSKKYRLVVAGISFNTLSLVDDSTGLFSLIRELRGLRNTLSNLILVAGGPHPSGDPLGTVESLGFDYAVVGEGEEAFPELLEELIHGDPLSVPGVFAIHDGVVYYRRRHAVTPLDEYPPFPFWRGLYGAIEITRGCPFGCSFCQVSFIFGAVLRHRSLENIEKLVATMGRRGLRDWRFITPNGMSYGCRGLSREPCIEGVEELLDRISVVAKRFGGRIFYGTFPSEIRPEHLTQEAARVLRRYVSNKRIIIGAQSGSNRVLKSINRGHTIEDVYAAVDAAVKHGFTPEVDFIVGLPGETNEDLLLTVEAMRRIVKMGGRIHLHVFMPLPGTPLEYAPPGEIPGWMKREVYRLIGEGRLYGQWGRQEVLARRIALFREKGIIRIRSKTLRGGRSV